MSTISFPCKWMDEHGSALSIDESVGRIERTSNPDSAYSHFAMSEATLFGAPCEIDFVFDLAPTSRSMHIGFMSLSSPVANPYHTGSPDLASPSYLKWYWDCGNTTAVAGQTGPSLTNNTTITGLIPVAARINIDANYVVRWYFGNGTDVLKQTSAMTAAAVKAMFPLRVVVMFNDIGRFNPVTISAEDTMLHETFGAGMNIVRTGTGIFLAERTPTLVVPDVAVQGHPRPISGKVWPRKV